MNRLVWIKKLRFLVDIRPEEISQTVLMFAYFFLVIASHTIVKSTRDALFINKYGAEQLPYVYIGIAIVAGMFMPIYSRLAQATERGVLIIGSNIFFVVNILAFWWLFHTYDWDWLSYGLYIWASIFSAVSTTQFWLAANVTFNPRQARRLFGFIISGGTLGGILAGSIARGVVARIGTENLLIGVAAMLLACVPIIRRVTQQESVGYTGRASAQKSDQNIGGAFALIQKNKHLTLLTMIIGVTVIATTLVDYQFKIIIQEAYKTKDALTGFFGSYYAYINVITILMQLLVTGQVLKRFGIGVAILIMPIGLFFGAFSILFFPALWAAIFVKTCDDSLSVSVNKSGIEVLYIPIPAEVKAKTKAFIDVVVERASRGIGGLLLLLLTVGLSLSVSQLSIFVLLLLGVWTFIGMRIQKEYIASLEATLQKRSLDADALSVNLSDSSTVNHLLHILDSKNERQILYALEFLQDANAPQLLTPLLPLLHHPSPEVKVQTLRLLFNIGSQELTAEIEALLEDNDNNVRAEAMNYVCTHGDENPVQKLRSFLIHTDYRMKGAAITCILRYGGDEERALLARDLIEEMLQETGEQRTIARQEAGKALGALDANSPLQDYLLELLNDESIDVVKGAIGSAGRIQRVDFVPFLIEKLGDSTTRVLAREALANYGSAVFEPLTHIMTDEEASMSVRRHIPRVFDLIQHQGSIDALLSNLNQDEIEIRYKIIKALGKLRESQIGMADSRNFVEVQFHPEMVESYIFAELKNYYYLLMIFDLQGENNPLLLKCALGEHLAQLKEMIFRLLGLTYAPDTMYNAYRGVISANPRIRANAIELLDGILVRHIKRMLLPIIEEGSRAEAMQHAFALWNLNSITKEEGIATLLAGKDKWLKACALYTVGQEGIQELARPVQDLLESPHPLIREAAEFAWRKLG
ncbi:MAG: Npt1/Npt2 family nucleotide transporter [Candidatus Poribacteria bacterium]